MDFGLSEQQQKWHDAAVRLAREDLVDPDGLGREQRGEFWREGYERCGKAGILGLPVPSEFGGQGADIPTAVAAMEGLGYGCADTGLIFALNASLWTITMPIAGLRHRGPEGEVLARAVRRPELRRQRRQRARGRLGHLQHDRPAPSVAATAGS